MRTSNATGLVEQTGGRKSTKLAHVASSLSHGNASPSAGGCASILVFTRTRQYESIQLNAEQQRFGELRVYDKRCTTRGQQNPPVLQRSCFGTC